MAITAHKLRRVEVWSTWAAASGVRQAVIDDAVILTATSNIAGSDRLDLTLPLTSPAASFVVPNAVIRVEEADATFDEWLILEGPNDDDGTGLRAVQALPIRAAMATCELVRRIDSDGTSVLDFESVGLTPAEHITAWVVPALVRGGMSWVVAGTITPAKLLDLTFASDTPLSVLQRIAEQTGMELDIRRTGGGYAIDLIAEIGSAQPTADLRFDKNLQPGTKRNRSSLESATRVFPIGADEEGRRATMSRATWKVTNIAGLIVTLADPAGGAGPIQFDGQLAGLNGTTAAYLRKPGGTLTAVTASSFANQTVTVASAASLAAGDLIQFRADSAGNDLLWLDSPPDRLLYGLKVAPVEMSDVPSTNNLLKNAVMRAWPGAPTSPPTNWAQVGGGTVARQAAAPYTRVGGFSIRRVGVADGDGLISDAVPIFPTALKPFISGYGGLWVVSGQVRVELVFTTGGGPVVQPLPPDFASNTLLGQWEDLSVGGIDANVLGATAVALRVVQHGSTVADFYLDYGQVTESGSQLPLAESSGGTRLWQAANESLRTNGAPLVSYAVQIVDLANLDPATWGADCKVVVGGKVRVTDPRLTLAITTRLVEMVRDYKVWGDTRLTLSNKPDDLTGSGARPSSPPRAPVDASDTLMAPAPPVLSASFDATGQLIINSSGEAGTTKQKIAWATGSAPTAAAVRATSFINQQNVSGLATGSVYPAGTTVFVAAFAYNALGFESAPLAVISVTREGSGTSAPPQAFITPLNGESDDLIWNERFEALAGSGGGGANLTWVIKQKIGFAAETTLFSGNATTLPKDAAIARHPRSDKDIRFVVTDTATGLTAVAHLTVPAARPEINDTGNPFRGRPYDDGDYTVRGTTASGDTAHSGVKESTGKEIRRQFAKPLSTSPDDADSVLAGLQRRIPLLGATDSTGNIDLAGTAWINKHAGNVSQRSPSQSGTWSASGVTLVGTAALINDGDLVGNAFHTDSAVAGAYVQVDMGAATTFDILRVYNATADHNGSWKVRHSPDGSAWTDAITGFRPTQLGWNIISFTAISRRYWRLELENTPGSGPYTNEVELVYERGGASVAHQRPIPTVRYEDGVTRSLVAIENSGNLNAATQQKNGTGLKNIANGRYSLGTGVHAQSITFPTNYQNPPAVNILGGISYEPASVWGTPAQADAGGTGTTAPNSARQIDEVVAYNVTASGASLRARLRQASATTARSDAYASGAITTNGGTKEATTANAPAANDTYTTDIAVQFTSSAPPGKACSVSGTVCLDYWNGSVWTQVASNTYSASDPVGGAADTGAISDTLVATVSGLTGSSKFRVRLVTNAGAGTRTYSVDPGNCTYTTTTGDLYATKTPSGLGINLSVEVIGAS